MTPSQFHRDYCTYYVGKLPCLNSSAVRVEYRLDILVKGLPSGDGDLEKTFREVNDKPQGDSLLKWHVINLIPIDQKAREAHILLDDGS